MRSILLTLITLISIALSAQTTHFVSTVGSTFSPNALTIDVGDSVVFTNTGGSHNVNGTQATFASNPASFGNAIGTGWVYGFKFLIAGTYNYRCDVHSTMMLGTITVTGTNSISDNTNFFYSIYPNPTSNFLTVKIDAKFLSSNKNISIVLYDIAGKEVMRVDNLNPSNSQLSMENLVNGIYFCSIKNGATVLSTEKIIKF